MLLLWALVDCCYGEQVVTTHTHTHTHIRTPSPYHQYTSVSFLDVAPPTGRSQGPGYEPSL